MRVLLFIPLALAACGWGRDCTAVSVAAITLEVLDARTGERVDSIWGGVTHGAYREALSAPSPGFASAAEERSGTYAVKLHAPGYRSWDTAGVTVARDECHVEGRRFVIRLQPLP